MSARSVTKVAKRAAKKTESARASGAARHAGARLKHAKAAVKHAPSRAKRILNSTPVRVLVGASALAFALAKLKQRLVG
jgi:hypothetical protein